MAPQRTQPTQTYDVITALLEELQAELRQLQELEHWLEIKKQILALRAKVGRSSEAEG
jgi:hypothetical protein